MGKKLTYEEVLKDVDLERPLPRSHLDHLIQGGEVIMSRGDFERFYMNSPQPPTRYHVPHLINAGISAKDAADALAAAFRNIASPTA